jgi:mRNA deadenylase 3'-5' endonuclease subunit Ccr4
MLKLISINIEQDRHHDTVIPFLLKENADVVCVQELFERDVPLFEKVLGMKCYFVRFYFQPGKSGDFEMMGVGLFAKNFSNPGYEYFVGSDGEYVRFEFVGDPYIQRSKGSRAVMWATVEDKEGTSYVIASTHFTWTPEGLSTKYQKEDAEKVITILDTKVKEFVFVGDTNAPRGLETFSMFAKEWKDTIPKEYDSSIDPALHRVKGLRHMVDVLFTTPEYEAHNVKLVEGVSDHKAVVAEIHHV